MTKPTLTYGHGFLDDGYDASGWSLFENYLSAILTVEIGDILKIEGTPTSSGDEYVSYRKNITNISSDIYPKFLIRYKTATPKKDSRQKLNSFSQIIQCKPSSTTALVLIGQPFQVK